MTMGMTENSVNASNDLNLKGLPTLPERILINLDGSDSSFRALDIALALASLATHTTTLAAIFIVDKASLDALLQLHYVVADEMESLMQELQEKGERTLEAARQRAENVGIHLNTYLLKGRIHQSILHAVKQLDANLLLLSGWNNSYSHKDGSSVEYQLTLDQAKCSVLVVK